MAYTPTIWENLPSTNTPVNATNLNHMDQGIYDANNIGQYSTSEIAVGTWIDGKTIYRKVFTGTNTTNISTGITPDNIIKMECLIHQTVGAWRTIPWLYSLNDTTGNGTWTGGFYFNDSDSTIRFQLGSNLAASNKVIVIMEYTK